MRMFALILTVVPVLGLVASARGQAPANQGGEEPAAAAPSVQELRQARITVLKDLTDQLSRLYQAGRAEFNDWFEARMQLVEAQLDAAETPADRVTLYKTVIEELTQSLQLAQAQVEAARGTTAAVLKIQARILDARIRLAEETAGKAAGKKSAAKATEKSAERPGVIVVSRPRVTNVDAIRQYVGRIEAQRHIQVRAAQSGPIEMIAVKEGQGVKQGDLLFKLAPSRYLARLDAELAEARIAELELQNTEKLYQDKVVSQLEAAVAKTKLDKAKARVQLAKLELSYTEVMAPFDGIIDRISEQQGALVKQGDALTNLSDNSVMRVYFNVPEARYLEYMAGAKEGEAGKVELMLAGGGKFEHDGKIGAIEADFNNDTGTIPFRADFPNPDRLLRHGMSGNVLLHRTLIGVVVVPQRATLEMNGEHYVYVVDQSDVAHRRRVEISNEIDDVFVVDKGLGGDDKIVVEGVGAIRDGEKVEYEFLPPEAVFRPKNPVE